MARQIFINLPVADVPAATAFYESLGFPRNPTYSDATTTCIVFSEHIYAMLMVASRFSGFLPADRAVSDARAATETLLCLSCDRREEVDELVEKAGRAGGRVDTTRMPEMEGMHGRSFEDLDGHVWEVLWMDEGAMEGKEGEGKAAEDKA